MPNSLPRRALISISSFNGAIYPGGRKTGGKSIIHGRTVTGFTIEGEMMLGILDKMREDKVVPIVEAVSAVGAFYSSPMAAFDDYSITSGRIVTGTNPESARSAAERAVQVFDTLQSE